MKIIPEIEFDKVVITGQNEQSFNQVKWRIVQKKGHTLFEINLHTGDVVKAEYVEVNLELLGENVRKKVITKPDCIYISALNIQNAAKKFIQKAKQGGLIK